MSHRIHVARDIAACAATVPLQQETWSGDVVVPPQLLLASVHAGGFVALAYVDGDDQAAGFVFGFPAVRDGTVSHHSHMLAVRPEHRGRDIALALKSAQRDHCLAQGVRVITWTMDPLEARNAHFNFNKLGAIAREHHRDFYGEMPDKLNAGMPSDRLIVEWPVAPRADAPGGATREIEIPPDIQKLKREDPPRALESRLAVRAALEAAFADGYVITGFARGAAGGRYLLTRA